MKAAAQAPDPVGRENPPALEPVSGPLPARHGRGAKGIPCVAAARRGASHPSRRPGAGMLALATRARFFSRLLEVLS